MKMLKCRAFVDVYTHNNPTDSLGNELAIFFNTTSYAKAESAKRYIVEFSIPDPRDVDGVVVATAKEQI